jgi:hypothetical protein
MRGNRRLNHVIHMAAVTQTDCKKSHGHAYYQRKLDEGKTPSEARRALKRKISNAIYARLRADASRASAGPGGQPGNGSKSSAAGSHPEHQLFGPATPEPGPSLRPANRRLAPSAASPATVIEDESCRRPRQPGLPRPTETSRAARQ